MQVLEHSAILSTFIKLLIVFKTFVLSIFEWPLRTGFTVHTSDNGNMNAIKINGSSISSCYLHLAFSSRLQKAKMKMSVNFGMSLSYFLIREFEVICHF